MYAGDKLLKLQGIFLIYLTGFAYCEYVANTVSVPTIDESYTSPTELLVNYTGSTDCNYVSQSHFTQIGSEVFKVKDINNRNICDRYTLFINSHEQFGNGTVSERAPALIGISVTVLGTEIFTASIGLVAIGAAAAIGGAIAGGWYLYNKFKNTDTQTVSKKRDYGRIFNTPRQSNDQIEVCYVDDPNNPNTQTEIENSHSMVQQATTDCVNQAISMNGATSIAPCKFEAMDNNGGTYDSVVIGGTTDIDGSIQNDCTFQPYN